MTDMTIELGHGTRGDGHHEPAARSEVFAGVAQEEVWAIDVLEYFGAHRVCCPSTLIFVQADTSKKVTLLKRSG
jgi:hypothetical protein